MWSVGCGPADQTANFFVKEQISKAGYLECYLSFANISGASGKRFSLYLEKISLFSRETLKTPPEPATSSTSTSRLVFISAARPAARGK
jgi:hypothetical protein